MVSSKFESLFFDESWIIAWINTLFWDFIEFLEVGYHLTKSSKANLTQVMINTWEATMKKNMTLSASDFSDLGRVSSYFPGWDDEEDPENLYIRIARERAKSLKKDPLVTPSIQNRLAQYKERKKMEEIPNTYVYRTDASVKVGSPRDISWIYWANIVLYDGALQYTKDVINQVIRLKIRLRAEHIRLGLPVEPPVRAVCPVVNISAVEALWGSLCRIADHLDTPSPQANKAL
jgi:hypothetical protein